ncbi:MAG: DUF4037 domain-containing protein [Oscillospiraceae bacterium]|jgi:hypothetical protein|nr:DUF4037 domain-containing protein [Oscillospiraceae bacterium]
MGGDFIRGLELARTYFFNTALPALRRDHPELAGRAAAGLVGNGSECFGYDDEISRDHDWGIDFFIWLPEADAGRAPELSEWKRRLFAKHPPAFGRKRSEYGARIGVTTCGDFYKSLVGFARGPETIGQWRAVPDENFAMAVNGEVFIDGAGEFTAVRDYLLGYYPEDLRLKKIAARCMSLAQTGQYNLERCARRGDIVTAYATVARFIESAEAMVFLLNRVFRPYYKWTYRAMTELPILGAETGALLRRAALAGTAVDTVKRRVAEVCALIADELRRQNLAATDDWFLTTHGEQVRQGIADEYLRSLPTQYE